MDHAIFMTPDQLALINDVIFDVSGMAVTLNELVIMTIATIALSMVLKSPYFASA